MNISKTKFDNGEIGIYITFEDAKEMELLNIALMLVLDGFDFSGDQEAYDTQTMIDDLYEATRKEDDN